jgi:hypothetical protein
MMASTIERIMDHTNSSIVVPYICEPTVPAQWTQNRVVDDTYFINQWLQTLGALSRRFG